jgi:hypothetical protein
MVERFCFVYRVLFVAANTLLLRCCYCICLGEDILKKVESYGTNSGTPKSNTVVDSGELSRNKWSIDHQ